MESTVGIGLLGAGTVGGSLVRRLVEEADAVAAKTGLKLELRRVAVRDVAKPRSFRLPDGVLTTDARAVTSRLRCSPRCRRVSSRSPKVSRRCPEASRWYPPGAP